jgi:hypothetical protein
LVFNEGLTKIGGYAFFDTNMIEKVILPTSLTTIGSAAFANNNYLEQIWIPQSVATIEANAFFGCDKLTIYLEVDTVPLTWNKDWNPNQLTVLTGQSGLD